MSDEWYESPGERDERLMGMAAAKRLQAEVDRLTSVLEELNELRSNVIATQRAGWSDLVYPLVAILNRAGFSFLEDRTPEQLALHLVTYRGAGGSPRHPAESRIYGLERQRIAELRESGSAYAQMKANLDRATAKAQEQREDQP